ncbi:MAG: sialidase family protein, partial [Ignavibacteriota bacterium]
MTSFTKSTTTSWMRTIDGGKSWFPITPAINDEAWSVYGVKGTSIFYAAPEHDPNTWQTNPSWPIQRSTDLGATWSQVSILPFLPTGHIVGFGEILYVQVDTERSKAFLGIYRSTDRGVSWQSVGGPSNDRDTRFSVTGCSGGVLYAFDYDNYGKVGNVWKTRNGGDGSIYEPPVKPQIYGDPIVFSGPICATSYAALNLENLYCFDDTIVLAEIVDTTSEIFKSGALSISASPTFPLALPANSKDSIRFKWEPSKLFHRDTTVTFQVKIRYFSSVLGQFFDTIITVSAHAIGESAVASILPPALDYANVSYCATHDSTITIRNFGCDTLYLLSASGSPPVHYQILDSNGNVLQPPLAIPPAGSGKITIRLSLDSAGSYSSDLQLTLEHQGLRIDTLLNISASVSGIGSYHMPDSINFGLVSTCKIIDTLMAIDNLGCNVPLNITQASLYSNTVFTLIGTPPYTPAIAANSTGNIHIRFAPNSKKAEVDTLTIQFYSLGELITKKIILRGDGVLNPPKFVTSLA